MQNVSCPSCGAQVQFRSYAAVLAVCEYCQATVLKDAGSVKDIGKMSSVLEDFTPIQIGTAGTFNGRNFTVVGRIQLRYSAGMWNEWYLLFDDASTAWLGDSSGLFALTTLRKPEGAVPTFDEIEVGKQYTVGNARLTASEKRTADCIGGQGELPFRVDGGWQAKVVDLRRGGSFITLDYSDEQVAVYNGHSVTLEQLKCQLLRDDDQIKASAGKFRGKVDALDCPSCGSNIKYLPGMTAHLLCPSCHAQIDAAGPKAEVLEAAKYVDSVIFSLPLGSSAKINGQDYTVIGAMRRADDENTEWTEYLLYSTRAAFFWLVETDEGWSRANVMSSWPQWDWTGADTATLDKVSFSKLYEYNAVVRYAAGAFNWRVAIGDQVRVAEFQNAQTKLAAERTAEELTWSRSTPVAFDQLKAWFGAQLGASAEPVKAASPDKQNATMTKFIWWIIGLNIIPMLAEFGSTWIYPVLAILAIYLPTKFMDTSDKGQ